ncbi:hypothetical protein JST56_06220 [Candidatus Dependentiae bacterium]|nr:hypothetical protein [Candidatus Dependentiae bacterium]
MEKLKDALDGKAPSGGGSSPSSGVAVSTPAEIVWVPLSANIKLEKPTNPKLSEQAKTLQLAEATKNISNLTPFLTSNSKDLVTQDLGGKSIKELEEFKSATDVCLDDQYIQNFPALLENKQSFEALKQLIDKKLNEKKEAIAQQEALTNAVLNLQKAIVNAKDITSLETFASIFEKTKALKATDDEKKGFIIQAWQQVISDKKTTQDLKNFIVSLNLDNWLELSQFPASAANLQQPFNNTLNAVIGTSHFDYYSEFKTTLDDKIKTLNTGKKDNQKVHSLVQKARENLNKPVTPSSSLSGAAAPVKTPISKKPLTLEQIESLRLKIEANRDTLKGLINSFEATPESIKALLDNKAGLDKLEDEDKILLKDKILIILKDKVTKSDSGYIFPSIIQAPHVSALLQSLGASDDEIDSIELPKPQGAKKAIPKASSESPAVIATSVPEDEEALKKIINKKPLAVAQAAGSPPTPPPISAAGSPPTPPPIGGLIGSGAVRNLDDDEIIDIIKCRNSIAKLDRINKNKLKNLVTAKRDQFSAKGPYGLEVLTALGITP